jgi:hypothetical protein
LTHLPILTMQILKLVLILLLPALICSSLLGRAQEAKQATVYIYANAHARMMKRAAAPVFLDDHEVALLDGSRFFVLHLDPGTYTFRSKDKKKGGAELEAKAGETYYLRLEWEQSGYFLRYSGIRLMPPENGKFEVKQAKPINRKDVKDSSIVDLSYVEGK